MIRPVSLKLLVAALCVALLGGCASRPPPLYYWGNYQAKVYGQLNGTQGPEEQIAALKSGIEEARIAGLALPPGYRAHLGMLHAASGRLDEASAYFEGEKAAFPESAGYMDFLLEKFKK